LREPLTGGKAALLQAALRAGLLKSRKAGFAEASDALRGVRQGGRGEHPVFSRAV